VKPISTLVPVKRDLPHRPPAPVTAAQVVPEKKSAPVVEPEEASDSLPAPLAEEKPLPSPAPVVAPKSRPLAFEDRRIGLVAMGVVLLLALVGAAVWWARSSSAAVELERGSASAGAVSTEPRLPAESSPSITGVSLRAEADRYRIQTPCYEAIVEPDGCLTGLRVGGTEFLWTTGPTSRGCYYFVNGAGIQKLTHVRQTAENVLLAQGPVGSICYEFGLDSLVWTLTNNSNAALDFHVVFDNGVFAAHNDAGEWAILPANRDWRTTTWYAGRSRLLLGGGTRLWGPFEQTHQAWAATLAPRETRTVFVKVGTTSDKESRALAPVMPAGGQ
jgi:hypothetical protein